MARGGRDDGTSRDAVNRRIRKRMQVLGLRQEDVAQRIGARQSSISAQLASDSDRWLSGDKVVRLPHALECSGHWLLTGEGPEVPADGSPIQATMTGYLSALHDIRQCADDLETRIRRPIRRV